MQNVTAKIVGKKLMIEVDLSKQIGPSSSGKTILIASTGKAERFTGERGDVYLGLNVYKYPDKKA